MRLAIELFLRAEADGAIAILAIFVGRAVPERRALMG